MLGGGGGSGGGSSSSYASSSSSSSSSGGGGVAGGYLQRLAETFVQQNTPNAATNTNTTPEAARKRAICNSATIMSNKSARFKELKIDEAPVLGQTSLQLVTRATQYGSMIAFRQKAEPSPDKLPVVVFTADRGQVACGDADPGWVRCRANFLEPGEHMPPAPGDNDGENAALRALLLQVSVLASKGATAGRGAASGDSDSGDCDDGALARILELVLPLLGQAEDSVGGGCDGGANDGGTLNVPSKIPDFSTAHALYNAMETGSEGSLALLDLDSLDATESKALMGRKKEAWGKGHTNMNTKLKKAYAMYVRAVLLGIPGETEIKNQSTWYSDACALFSGEEGTSVPESVRGVAVPDTWATEKGVSWFRVAKLAQSKKTLPAGGL